MQQFCIGKNEAGQRFDKYLKKLLSEAPGSFLYRMLRKKNITLNGAKADGAERLCEGDKVCLFFSEETFEKFSGGSAARSDFRELKELRFPADSFPVVYEDTDILIINKPSGMLSQKAEQKDVSANEYILSYLIGKGELTEEMSGTFRPSVCNRLDRNTSGLLAAGKTLKGLKELSEAFRERTVKKYYRCIVAGEVKEPVYIKGWLLKDHAANKVRILPECPRSVKISGGQENAEAFWIETEYFPVRSKNGFSELEVRLITGRTHQIRAHLAAVLHPVVGDEKYGSRAVNRMFREKAGIHSQLLHACRMEFADGRTAEAPCGREFRAAWDLICQIKHA